MPTVLLKADKITTAYNALNVYNYFAAKKIFEKSIQKKPTEASYGLSIIYSRNDNPFSNIDSAYKYIIKTLNCFNKENNKKKLILLKFNLSQQNIDSLKELIHQNATAFFQLLNDQKSD